MGRRMQRRDDVRVDQSMRQESAPFVYIDLRSRVEQERVAERHYDSEGRLRAERFGHRQTVTYRPYPNLLTSPSRRTLIAPAAARALDAVGLLVLYVAVFLGGVAVTSLFYVWAGWWGAGVGMVATASLLVQMGQD